MEAGAGQAEQPPGMTSQALNQLSCLQLTNKRMISGIGTPADSAEPDEQNNVTQPAKVRRRKGQPVRSSQQLRHFRLFAERDLPRMVSDDLQRLTSVCCRANSMSAQDKIALQMKTKTKELGSFAYCAVLVTFARKRHADPKRMHLRVVGAPSLTRHLMSDASSLTPELMSGAYAALAKNAKSQG